MRLLRIYAASYELKRLTFFNHKAIENESASLNKLLDIALHSTIYQNHKCTHTHTHTRATASQLICARRTTLPKPTQLACFRKLILKETNQKADPKVTPNTSSTVNGKENRTEIAPPALASHYLLRVTPGQDRSRDGRWGIKAGGGEADTREELGADCAGLGRPQGPSGRKGLGR